MTQDVVCTVTGAVGLITLNRPKALNALTLDMIRVIDPQLTAWASDPRVKAVVIRGAGDRAFCAGGDVRAVWDAGMARARGEGDAALTREFFREEYRLNRRIKTFHKPYVALLDGITMGGGVGLSVHGSHRVTTEKALLAMPETGIGLFPDVGGTWFLPRLPGQVGTWLGLTGQRLGAADLLPLGIATHHSTSTALDAIVADLASAVSTGDPHAAVDAVLGRHAADPGVPTVPQHRADIDRCFQGDTVEGILHRLDAEGTDWAADTARTIRSMSPSSLKMTLRQIRIGAGLTDFDDAMRLEYRLTGHVMAGHDFYEGIRAVLVDKDRKPRWNPPTLAEVDDATVTAWFQPGPDELTFD